MKHRRTRSIVIASLGVGFFLTTGCQNHDRQMIFTAPRSFTSRIDAREAKKKGNRVARSERPAPRSIPASNGIDVPIVDPD